MKLIHSFNSRGIGSYELYGESEPTPISKNKTVRYFKLYRTDVIVPFEVANYVQTKTKQNSSLTGNLVHSSEKSSYQEALNWLTNNIN